MAVPVTLLTLGLAGCSNDDSVLSSEDDLVVVQGYLFAGEPVDDIRLTQTVPLDATQTGLPLSGVVVTLMREDVVYALGPIDAEGTYGYPGTDLTVSAGDIFQLRVIHDRGVVTAITQVPPAPNQVLLSTSEVRIDPDPFDGGFGGGFGRPTESALTISWISDAGAYHQVIVASEDPEATIIDRGFGDDFELPPLQQQPTRRMSVDLNALQFGVYGPWSVTVYRLNDEYGQLFEFGTQDPQDLEEPPSNVEGGLGIFTALHGLRVIFDVLPDTTASE